MSEIWFTSDTHFSHDKGFLYKPRGFSCIKDMNEAIVENWNKVIKPNDIVYHLGDIALNDMNDAIKYIKKLNGTIHLIRGNHDTENKLHLILNVCWDKIIYCGWADVIKDGKKSIYMSHYPTLTANYDTGKHFSQNVINLHGHIHSKNNWMIPTNPFIYHVGVDSHNCTPVHIDEILTDIRQRWNEIGKLSQNLKPEDTYPYEKNLF